MRMTTAFAFQKIATSPQGRGLSRWRLLGLVLALVLLATPSARGGERLAIGVHPNTLVIIDTSRDEIVAQIPTHGRAPKEVVPSPDGKRVYLTTEARQNIEVANLESRKVEDVIDFSSPVYRVKIFGIAVSRKGDRLFAHVKPVQILADEFRVEPPQIWEIGLSTHKRRKVVEVPEGVPSLVVLGDDRHLVAWGRDLYYIDIAQGRITDTFRLLTARTPDQGQLNTLPFFVQYEQSGIFSTPYFTTDPITKKDLMGLANLDVETGKLELIELGSPLGLYSAVVSPDHKRAYMVMNQVVVVDLEKKKIVHVQDTERTKYVANLTRDGKKLYLPSSGPFIDVYDTETLKLIKRIDLPGDPSVSQMRILPAVAAR